MINRSKNSNRLLSLRRAACTLEFLESRTLLSTSSVVLGAPTNLSAATAGVTPQFDWLAPLVTGSSDDDLIVSNSSNSIGVLLNKRDGTGAFNNATTYAVAGAPLPITTGELITGSTTQDIVVGTTGSPGDISILIGNGDGTFQPAINHTALASNHAIAVGDFITGGPAAIVTADNTSSTTNNLAICFTDGAGHITAVDPINIGHGGISAIAVGEFTGSGNEDIAVLSQTDSTVTLLKGNGNGTFQSPVDFKTGASPTSLAVGDFNGDGKLDIVTANSTAGTVSFLAGSGTGSFAAKVDTAVTGSAVGGGPLKVRVANFTNNGKADLLCLLSPGSTGDATILLGQGNGTFQNIQPIATGGATRSGLAVGDLNGDGLTDIVLSDPTQITSLRNITNSDNSTPTATLNAATPGSSQSSIYQFTVTYSDSQQVDAQTLGNTNIIVTAPAGVTFPGANTQEAATLVSTNLTSAASITATYQLTFSSNLTQADAGNYAVSMASGAGAVTNASGIPVNPGTFGTLQLSVVTTNEAPPTASVAANQTPGSQQGNFYQFNVTYTSTSSEINTTSLGDNNLVVTAPAGVLFASGTGTQTALLISQNLTNASTVVATYQVSFSSNLTSTNVGAYGVSVNANSVTDTNNIPVAAGSIGAFDLSLASNTPPPTGDFTPSAPKGKFKASVVSGTRQTGVTVTVVNTSNNVISGTVTVILHSSLTPIVDNTATALTSINHVVKKLKHGKGFVIHFKPFSYPSVAGQYYLVADAKLNGTADSYDGATASTINVAAAFIDVRANSVTPNKAVVTVGKRNTVTLSVTNLGNVTMHATPATVSIYASADGILDGTQTLIGTVALKLTLNASQTKKVLVNYTPASLPASGTYKLIATIAATGDNNAVNNTVTSLGTVTI